METIAFKMPKMGESITEGTILQWLVNEGESFEEGDILVEVATDKVDNEVPAPVSGRIISQLVQVNDVVPVGEPLALLEVLQKATKVTPAATSNLKQGSETVPIKKAPKVKQGSSTKPTAFTVNESLFVSPLIDRIAREQHISYEELA